MCADSSFVTCFILCASVLWTCATTNVRRQSFQGMNVRSGQSRSADAMNFTGTYELVKDWPSLPSDFKLGQVTAVSMNRDGTLAVLHRADRDWVPNTFDRQNKYRRLEDGPISADTVLFIDPESGKLMGSWGKDMFFMPHGLTIDHEDNLWITDAGAHQVFKFAPTGAKLMELGVAMEPGDDNYHFCKPTATAVEKKTGDIFVADGYCNSRVMKFSADGRLLGHVGKTGTAPMWFLAAWIRRPKERDFNIVHKIAIDQERGVLFIADRENGRVQALMTSDFTYVGSLNSPQFGGRVFSVAFTPAYGGLVIGVNGPKATGEHVKGFVLNPKSRSESEVIASTFGDNRFREAHDVYATTDAREVFVAETRPHRLSKYVLK